MGCCLPCCCRIQGSANVFAVGDINNTESGKLGYLADLQVWPTYMALRHSPMRS